MSDVIPQADAEDMKKRGIRIYAEFVLRDTGVFIVVWDETKSHTEPQYVGGVSWQIIDNLRDIGGAVTPLATGTDFEHWMEGGEMPAGYGV